MKKIFRIVPLPTAVAESARRMAAAGQADHQVVIADAPNAFPCRHCLRWATPGESMILFPYQSIATDRPYAESGPIFVHQETCERYSTVDEYPEAFRQGRAIRGYNSRDEIIEAKVPGDHPRPVIEGMLANPEIAFLQVRSATHGCYTMIVERA